MLRAVIGVVIGYALWTVIWLAGNAVLFGELAEHVGRGEPYSAAGPLAGVLVLSVVCSLAAGAVAGLISRQGKAVLITGLLLLITGIGVQAKFWALEPVWYHLAFLALLVPICVLGGKLTNRRRVQLTTRT